MSYTKKKTIKRTSNQTLNRLHKRIYRTNKDHNLSTLYILITVLAVLFVFPAIVNTVITLVMLSVVTGLGLVSFVVINRTNDYRQRPLQQRLIEALPDNAFKYAAMGKFLSGNYAQQYKVVPQIEEDIIDIEATVEPIVEIPFNQAYKQSNKYEWNIGQIDGTNDLATFNFTKQSHVLVCGGTNCGKTSTTGFMLALYALKSKFHVVVFDGAGGSDWNEFKPYTEHYEATPEHLEVIISNIERLYTERQDKLKELGVANNYDLDKPIQPIVIIIDELGYLLDGLKGIDRNHYKTVVARLQKMIRVIRKTSIHLVLIDQNANSIPQEILTNIKCIFAYNAEGYIGSAIKRFNLDKLKPQGQFDYNHKVVNGWHTKKFLGECLPSIKPVKQVLMLTVSNDNKLMVDDKDCIVDTNKEQLAADFGGIPPVQSTVQVQTVQPKVISTRPELVAKLIELKKSNQTINDSTCRKLHQELYGKSINGNASKQIIEYVNLQT
jgi:hypothetical protein